MFLESIVHISKGKFIGNPNEKEISRVARSAQLVSFCMVQIMDTPEMTNIFKMEDTTTIFHMVTLL